MAHVECEELTLSFLVHELNTRYTYGVDRNAINTHTEEDILERVKICPLNNYLNKCLE